MRRQAQFANLLIFLLYVELILFMLTASTQWNVKIRSLERVLKGSGTRAGQVGALSDT